MLGLRLANVACRTAHLVAVSALLGGALWEVDPAQLRLALWTTVATGFALAGLEALSAPGWLLEARGLAVVLKLALLAPIPYAPGYRVSLMIAALIVAGVGSHLPRRFRHASLTALWTSGEPGRAPRQLPRP